MKSKTPVRVIPTVPSMEWERILEESEGCRELLNSPRFKFFRDYLKAAKESILQNFAQNISKDVVETITDPKTGYSKSIKTTKEEQQNEMSGQFKLIDKIFADLETFSKQKEEYIKLQEKKKLKIEISKEDDGGKTLQ